MEETTPDSDPILTTADTNPNTAAPSFRLLLVAGNSAFGAFVGSIFGFGKGLIKKKGFKGSFVEARSSAKTFAVSYGVENLVLCEMNRLRGKDDVINAGVAGCCSGLALSFPGTPRDLVQSCLTYGAFSFIFEGLYRKLALPQKSSADLKSHLQHSVLPP